MVRDQTPCKDLFKYQGLKIKIKDHLQDLDDEKAIELLQQSKLLHEQNEAAKADKRAVGFTLWKSRAKMPQ